MTTSYSLKLETLLIGLLMAFSVMHSWAQARLILDHGGYVNITNGAYLVVANPAANAITRNTSGHIISEGENNIVKWSIGTTAASYTVPWGYGTTNYIPVSLTTASASGSGFFNFSTYHTGWNNSTQLPTGVNTFSSSPYVLDRFWRIEAQGYTSKPALTNLVFTYLDAEHSVASNTITESNLMAQRYNSTSNQWGDYGPAGVTNTTSNTVTIASLTPANLFSWWILVDLAAPLPVELVSFFATPRGQAVSLEWITASEKNNDYFTIQRSVDGKEFSDIAKVTAGSAGNTTQTYEYVDLHAPSGRLYYRLKQTDLDGTYTFSDTRRVELTKELLVKVTVSPNPVVNGQLSLNFQYELESPTSVMIYDVLGRIVFSKVIDPGVSVEAIDLSNSVAGSYIVKTINSKFSSKQTIILK